MTEFAQYTLGYDSFGHDNINTDFSIPVNRQQRSSNRLFLRQLSERVWIISGQGCLPRWEFYDTYCLTLLAAHNYAFVLPIVKWGEAIQAELSTGWSRVIDHDLRGEIDGHTWTVDFPVSVPHKARQLTPSET